MSPPFKGKSPETGSGTAAEARDSMIASNTPRSNFFERRAPETQLTELALRLAGDLSAADSIGEAIGCLAYLLPDSDVEVKERVSGDPTASSEFATAPLGSASDAFGMLDSSVRALGRCEWRLTQDANSPSLHIVLRDVHQPREVARVLEIGERVALLLGAALRRAQDRARLQRQREEMVTLRERVIQAEKLAHLGQLVASVLHDLNNPLTAILTYTEYLQRTLAQGTMESADLERLSRIRDAAEAVLRQTRSLVEYSCPPRTPFSAVDMGGILRRALLLCEHEFEHSDLRVRLRVADHLPVIDGHAEQLTQLFVNLFTNAAHAARAGNAVLDVEAFADASAGRVVVKVHDNGLGIQPADIEHVFDPFYTTRVGSGCGLGLSIVRDIAEHHGGTIDVASVPSEGTTFVLSLPAGPVLP